MEDTPGFSDRWNAVLRLLEDAIKSLTESATIINSVTGFEPLALEVKRLQAEVSLCGIQVRRARAGLK